MKNIWYWLITSSADPKKTAATATGLMLFAGGYVIDTLRSLCSIGVQLACLNIDSDWLAMTVSFVGDIITGGLMVVGATVAVFGLLRKAWSNRWTAFGKEL